jgi:hypothetical protein
MVTGCVVLECATIKFLSMRMIINVCEGDFLILQFYFIWYINWLFIKIYVNFEFMMHNYKKLLVFLDQISRAVNKI